MLTRLDLRGISDLELLDRLPRPKPSGAGDPRQAVRQVLADVRAGGDAAVRACTSRFDGVAIDELRVSPEEMTSALDAASPSFRAALESACLSIESYHRHQMPDPTPYRRDGVTIVDLPRPVGRAGAYVPGGRAGYPSTVLMTAVPARVAGVSEIVVCVPPGPDGRVGAPTLAAAALAGVDEVYRIGGAQAVAAMAYGTESVRAVDVIVGPGNIYVSIAKREVAAEGVVGVPAAFAGPSEVVVVADHTVPPAFAAVDVVVQAEHGPHGLAWLVTWSDDVADAVCAEVQRVTEASPRQAEIRSTLDDGGYAVLVDGPEQAMAVANAIAPEHLQLMCESPEALLPLVSNAGAVFCGPWSPASVGDYLAGPSHVLPTYGSARFASGLRVDDFLRTIHAVTFDQAALDRVAGHVAAFAETEGLYAHAESVKIRAGVTSASPTASIAPVGP